MTKSNLRVIDPTQPEHPRDTGRRLVKRHRNKLDAEARLNAATIREGAGMRWMPAWYKYWWGAPVVRPADGETWRRLYG